MSLFKKKNTLNTNILREYRYEALGRMRFIGAWSGFWETRIDGITYHSERVSGFKAIKNDYGTFIQDAIIDRVKLRRNPEKFSKDFGICRYGGYRFINKDGNAETWNW